MNAEEKRAFNKELLTLAVPLGLQVLLTALVGASDALMLGRLNQASVAAVSLANQISFVMSLFVSSVVGSVGVLVAQYLGKKDERNAKRFMSMALRYSFLISLVFTLAALLAPEKLMALYTPEPELIDIGAGYLRIVSVSYLLSGISQCYLMVMKIDGRARLSVWISALTVLVDMGLDFFLIYGYGAIPALGANGSAYSTIAVEAVALVWCVWDGHRKGHLHPDMESMRYFSKTFEKDLWKIEAPMLASSLSWGLSITVHSMIMGRLGTDATAASSVTAVTQQLIQCLAHGIASGSGIMLGKLLGQNEFDKAKAYGRRFWHVSMLCGLANMLLLAALGPVMLRFYVLEPQAKEYLTQMLIFSAFYMFAYAFNTVFTCGVLPAGGDAKYDAVSVFFATWCFALPVSILGAFVFHWPVMAVYCVMCCDEIIKLPFLPLHYRKYTWVKNLTRETID